VRKDKKKKKKNGEKERESARFVSHDFVQRPLMSPMSYWLKNDMRRDEGPKKHRWENWRETI